MNEPFELSDALADDEDRETEPDGWEEEASRGSGERRGTGMEETNTSPLPWRVNPYGDVRDAEGFSLPVDGFTLPGGNVKPDHRCLGNTALIVRTVNAHAGLVEAAGQAHLAMVALGNALNWDLPLSNEQAQAYADAINALRAALARAEGEEGRG